MDGLGKLIETAANWRWERTRHTQSKDAKYRMYRYDSTFAFPIKDGGGAVQRVRTYNAELLIRNASDGKKYLYDIVNIKENTAAQSDLTEREAGSAAHKTATGRGVSDARIDETGGDVKARFSLKSTDSQGRELSESQREYFKDSVVRDSQSRLKVVYHGSTADFNEFRLQYLGTNGTAEGYGFYFTDNREIAEDYSLGTQEQRYAAYTAGQNDAAETL